MTCPPLPLQAYPLPLPEKARTEKMVPSSLLIHETNLMNHPETEEGEITVVGRGDDFPQTMMTKLWIVDEREAPPLPQSSKSEPVLNYSWCLILYRRASPIYEAPPEETYNPDEPKEDDSEARSVFVSQLAARLTARDLGYFFEDKLGEGTVMDSRIVTDRLSRRSKG